jgi:hypothetical protein
MIHSHSVQLRLSDPLIGLKNAFEYAEPVLSIKLSIVTNANEGSSLLEEIMGKSYISKVQTKIKSKVMPKGCIRENIVAVYRLP